MRVAETRAVNRALRKAYGIGLCSVDELGWLSGPPNPPHIRRQQENSHAPNGSNNGQPRLRDRLCLLIRQYGLDPALVKAHAADFCGRPSLKEAKRDLVESFISHLAVAAKEDRDGLLCKLNSYAQPEIFKSQVNHGARKELYYFRDQQGLEIDFLIPRPNAGLWLVECKAGKTVRPAMATPLLSLRRVLGKRSRRLIIVHRKSRSIPATAAVANGVEALDLARFISEFIRGH